MQNSVTQPMSWVTRTIAFAAFVELDDPLLALRAEHGVAGGEDLVDEEDVGIDRGRDREAEPGPHPGRVRLDRCVDELADVGELDDPGQAALHLAVVDAEERAGQADVVAAREILIEPGPERQQARDVADDLD